MTTYATLEVTHYETQAHLGWTSEERATPQKIAIDITLRYATLPHACVSDELHETQCYAQLLEWTEAVCQSKPFKLMEHLAYGIQQSLKQQLHHSDTRLSVRIHKLHPPIPSLKCASFTVSEL